jgi:nucleoside-diphosphate-sugar epimerase
MRIMVFGAAGFIGSHFTNNAIAEGHELFFPTFPDSKKERLGRNLTFGLELSRREDMYSLSFVKEAKVFRPEGLVDFSWNGVSGKLRNDPAQLANLTSTMKNLLIGQQAGIDTYLGLGSQAEYGPKLRAIDEDEVCAPTTLYGISKLEAKNVTEALCSHFGVKHNWIRVFSTYGPGDSEDWFIPSLIEKLVRGKIAELTEGNQYWDFLHVTDASAAILRVLERRSEGGVMNLGSGTTVRIREVAEMLESRIPGPGKILFGAVPNRPDQVTHLEADIKKIRQLTGWQPSITLPAGIEALVMEKLAKEMSQHD